MRAGGGLFFDKEGFPGDKPLFRGDDLASIRDLGLSNGKRKIYTYFSRHCE